MDCKYKLALFDFDYTLADSSKGAISCINFALNELGLNTVSDEIACRTIGLSLEKTFMELCNENQSDRITEFTRLFVEHSDRVMVNLTEIYDTVPETIRFLKNKGIKVGIISSKYRYRIEETLMKAELQNVFDYIVGGQDVIYQKPHSEGIIKAVEKFNYKLDEILYVGDSLTDAETAKNSGVDFIAALTGVTKKEEFSVFNVYRYIDDISELIDLFA